jgi:hypothetical protein
MNNFAKKAILLFIIIIIIIPFCESKRVLKWGMESEFKKENIFSFLVLSYAYQAEKIKELLGWNNFSKEEENQPLENSDQLSELPEQLEEEKKVLVLGDSFIAVSGGVGEILERELLKYKEVDVVRRGKVSSGLSRPDYFDWPKEAKKLISQYQFNIVVVMLGSNDAQSLTNSEGDWLVNYGEMGWNDQYAKRVSDLLDIFEQNNMIVFWIGFPVMKSEKYSQKIANLNSIYEQESQNYQNVYFISTWNLLTDSQGNYTAYLLDQNGKYKLARQSDGIHLTYFGGTIVVKEITQKMEDVLNLELK